VELAFELAFAAGLTTVALSFGALALGRARERYLILLTVVLALAALAAAGALTVNVLHRFTDNDPLLLAAGGLAAAAIAELGLVALARGFRRTRDIERLSEASREVLATFKET
jgi:hypothetical protein